MKFLLLLNFTQMAVRTNIQLSLLDPDENPAIVVTGDQLRQLSETELDQILKFREIVFSRTSPQQKLTIVEAVQVKLCSLPFQSRNSSPPPQATLDLGLEIGFSKRLLKQL